MKQKHLISLAVVTVFVVGAAIYSVEHQDESTADVEQSRVLFPDLKTKINSVDEITVQTHSDKLNIKRNADGTWVVASKYNYPAKFDVVKETVVGLANMKAAEPKTADPKLFPDLGLADVTADKSKAKLVTLESNGKAVASVLFGKRKYVPGIDTSRTYVRKPSGGRAWLVEGAPSIESRFKDWMVTDTVAVPRERVKEAVLSGPDRPTLTVYRESKTDKNFKVRNLPKGAKLQYDSVPDSVAGALAYISFDDVKPASDIDFSKADTARFQTFDGLQVTASLAKVGKETWIKFDAEALPGAVHPEASDKEASDTKASDSATAADKTASSDTASKDKEKDKKKAKPLDVPAEAKAIDARVRGWAYKIADYKAKDLTKRLSDLLAKDEKTKKKSGGPKTTGS